MITHKKLLFVLPRMGGGGAERVTALLANALSKQNNDISILTLVGGESFYNLDSSIRYSSVGITVNRKNKFTTYMSEAMAFPKSFAHIRDIIKREKYDIVISMLVETDILVGMCKWTGLRFNHVCSERNDPTRRSKLQLLILNCIYKKSSLFVCQSENVANFYKQIPNEKKVVIPNPIDPYGLPKRLTVGKKIVAVGKLMDQKNFELLIRSFAKVSNEFPEYVLIIYGEGERRGQLEKLIIELGIKNKVELPGASKQVLKEISDAELFVMSSNFEGFPNVLLEAMAIGIPVISTDFPTGTARELVGKKNGLLVPVGNEKELSNAIKILLSDVNLRKSMGKSNREKAKQYYMSEIIKQWNYALECF